MRSVHASGRKRSCSTLTSSRLLRTTSTCDVPFTSTSTNDSSAPTSEVVILELRWNEQHLAATRQINLFHGDRDLRPGGFSAFGEQRELLSEVFDYCSCAAVLCL